MMIHGAVRGIRVTLLERGQDFMVLARRIHYRRFIHVPQERPNPHDLFFQIVNRARQVVVADNGIEQTMKLFTHFTAAHKLVSGQCRIGRG